MDEHILILKGYIEHLEYMKEHDESFDREQADKNIEAFKAAIKALEQEPVLDKIKAEVEQIEINGHIRDVECFNAGVNTVLNIINKYGTDKEKEEITNSNNKDKDDDWER